MTRDSNKRTVGRLLRDLSAGLDVTAEDLEATLAAARALAAADVGGREQDVLEAFDAADDDAVRLWIAIALARAGQEVGLEELLARWREDPDATPLLEAYPRPEVLAREIQAVLPLHAVATPLLEHHAQTFRGTWIGDLALMLLGRWVPEEQRTGGHARRGQKSGFPTRDEPDDGVGIFDRLQTRLEGTIAELRDRTGFAAAAPDGDGFDFAGAERPGDDLAFGESPPRSEPEVAESVPPPRPASAAAPSAPPPSPAPAAPAPQAAAEPEPVLLGGSAPTNAQPNDAFLAQFVAYTAAFEPRARESLEREAAPGDKIRLGEETDCRWPVGTRVTVSCRARGLVVPTPVQSFTWNGQCRDVSFDIEVPADAKPFDTVIIMEAYIHDSAGVPDPVQVGRLRMQLKVTDTEIPPEARAPQTVKADAPRTAFASYASPDRVDVLERVSSIRRSTGMDVFVDVVDLRMGDQWNPALEKHILSSDRFLLFWSENAAKSEWVKWEREQAVKAKGEDVLELHLLRQTPIDLVPQELRKYHFNDIYIQARDAELLRQQQAAAKPKDG
jgi:hypothetical protein